MAHTIVLNMIVKNESKIIRRSLETVVDYLDYYVISDTGSTDNTKEIIREIFDSRGIRGEIHDNPFEDFGYNRTLALNLAKGKGDFILLMDADMMLRVKNQNFKAELDKNVDVYNVFQGEDFVYQNARLVNGTADYEYISPTHEYLSCKKPGHRIVDIDIDNFNFYDHQDGNNRADKFKRDIKLLLGPRGLQKEPNNERYMFYLAQSYKDDGDPETAIQWYKKRIDAGGWHEEVWYSMYQIGKCYERLEKWGDAYQYYMEAHAYCPERSETLYEVVAHYRNSATSPKTSYYNKMAYDIAIVGCKIPFPKARLFIYKPHYDYMFIFELTIVAYYAGHKEIGYDACEYIMHSRQNIPQHTRSIVNGNILHYMKKLSEYITVDDTQRITITMTKENHNICNTSIIKLPNDKYLFNVREVSYLFNIEENNYYYDDTIDTFNHIIEIDENGLENLNAAYMYDDTVIKFNEPGMIKLYPNKVTGLEDVRLIYYNGNVWGVCACRITNEVDVPEMLLFRLNDKYKIEHIVRLKGYCDNLCQKNWSPVIYNSELHLLYSSDPCILLRPDLDTGYCSVVFEKAQNIDCTNYRGSSQVLEYSGGYIYIIHQVFFEGGRRYYYHRFVYTDGEFNIIEISPLFYFINKTIEFVAGMTYNKDGTHLLITLGYEDKRAYMVKINVDELPKILNLRDRMNRLRL